MVRAARRRRAPGHPTPPAPPARTQPRWPPSASAPPAGEQAPGAATTGRWRTPARPVPGKAGEPGRGPAAAPPPRPGRRSPPGSSPFGSSACCQQRAGNDQGQRAGHDAGDIEPYSRSFPHTAASTHERHRESAHPRRRRHSPHRSYRPRATADAPAEGRATGRWSRNRPYPRERCSSGPRRASRPRRFPDATGPPAATGRLRPRSRVPRDCGGRAVDPVPLKAPRDLTDAQPERAAQPVRQEHRAIAIAVGSRAGWIRATISAAHTDVRDDHVFRMPRHGDRPRAPASTASC